MKMIDLKKGNYYQDMNTSVLHRILWTETNLHETFFSTLPKELFKAKQVF